jgi:hypothetical protein
MMSASAARSITARCISSARRTRTTSTPGGTGSRDGPETSSTRAPRRAASAATA